MFIPSFEVRVHKVLAPAVQRAAQLPQVHLKLRGQLVSRREVTDQDLQVEWLWEVDPLCLPLMFPKSW